MILHKCDASGKENSMDTLKSLRKRWLADILAHRCYFEGTNNTTEGNYIFDLDATASDLYIDVDNELFDDELVNMVIEELTSSSYVLDVDYTKGTNGSRILDVNFSTIFIEE